MLRWWMRKDTDVILSIWEMKWGMGSSRSVYSIMGKLFYINESFSNVGISFISTKKKFWRYFRWICFSICVDNESLLKLFYGSFVNKKHFFGEILKERAKRGRKIGWLPSDGKDFCTNPSFFLRLLNVSEVTAKSVTAAFLIMTLFSNLIVNVAKPWGCRSI